MTFESLLKRAIEKIRPHRIRKTQVTYSKFFELLNESKSGKKTH